MKPASFDYVRATTIADAVAALAEHGTDARPLAGGQSLIPLMNYRMARPAVLVDLGRVRELDYIRRDSDWLAIGAMTRQADAEASALVRELCPLVAKTLPYLGHPVIRHRGTIGGTLAHADRVAELPATALALDAELVAANRSGRRTIRALDFFIADLTTALVPGELLIEVRFPVARVNARAAFVEASNRHHDFAIVGTACQIECDADGRCTDARLAAMGVGSHPVRLRKAEQALIGTRLDDRSIDAAAHASADDASPEDDMHASADYRRRALAGLVRQALADAAGVDRRSQ